MIERLEPLRNNIADIPVTDLNGFFAQNVRLAAAMRTWGNF
jgi:hypothetical protein